MTDRRPLRRIVAILGGLTVVTVGVGALAGSVPPCSVGNIVDLELARTAERATELIGGCDADGLDTLRRALRIDDLGFIPLYVVSISAWVLVAAQRLTWKSELRRRLLLGAVPAVVVAGVFDLVENHHLRTVIDAGGASDAASSAFTASIVKWILVVYAFGAATVALVLVARAAFARERDAADSREVAAE